MSKSHSYTFERFAFYVEGATEAVVSLGSSLVRTPAGTSWARASTISWGSNSVGTGDVTSQVPSAVVRNGAITAFIVPEMI